MVNRMQFRQPRWKFLQAGRNKVNSKSKNIWKKFLKKKQSSKRKPRLRQRKEFWRTRRKFLPEGRKSFTQFTKMKKLNISFQLNISGKKFGMDT